MCLQDLSRPRNKPTVPSVFRHQQMDPWLLIYLKSTSKMKKSLCEHAICMLTWNMWRRCGQLMLSLQLASVSFVQTTGRGAILGGVARWFYLAVWKFPNYWEPSLKADGSSLTCQNLASEIWSLRNRLSRTGLHSLCIQHICDNVILHYIVSLTHTYNGYMAYSVYYNVYNVTMEINIFY